MCIELLPPGGYPIAVKYIMSKTQNGPSPPNCWSFSNTHTNTHTIRLIWRSAQFVAGTATYTTHNKHKWRTSISLEGCELSIAAI